MNFAVIADDISFPRLFDMIGQWQGEVVACSGKVGRKQLPPGVILGWEPRSETPQGVEVVLASGVVPTVATAVPSLVRQGLAVWLIPESVLGSDFVYAQIPLDEEFPDQLRAVWPLRQSRAVIELQRQLATGDLGAVLHLQMERSLACGPSFTPTTAEAAWLQDADLLRLLADGDYRRVTAIHSGLTATGISTASVGLSGEAVPDAMWAFRGGTVSRAELTVTTERGASVLLWEGAAAPTLTINCHTVEVSPPVGRARLLPSREPETTSTVSRCSAGASPSQESSILPAANADITARLPKSSETSEVSGDENSGRLPKADTLPIGVTPWSEAVRAFDLLDAARRSLVRRRTVELQFESTSERSQFKTHMTTVGCGLLLYTMFGLIGILFVGRMFDPRDTQQKQSEVAGFVLTEEAFSFVDDVEPWPDLSPSGREILGGIIENYQRRSATILIEGEPEPPTSRSQLCRTLVMRELTAAKLVDVEVRTLVRPLRGVWFKRGMVLAWVILFLPLGIFLVVQFLIGVTPTATSALTRPGTSRR